MYKVSGRQLILLAVVSAVLAGVIVACAQKVWNNQNISLERPVVADPSVATDEQNNIEVYRAVSPGVVFITSKSYVETWYGVYPQEGSGSGSIIDDQGHILTNYHVVQGATQLEVQIGQDKYAGSIVGTDRDNDLAIIKVDAPRDRLTVVRLGASKGLAVGQKVLAIGNPFGLQQTLTTGVISGLERPLRDPASRRIIEGAIQTDASINPGNSGGPLLNARGEMIGINTMIYSPNGGGSVGIGFAVPVDAAKKIIPELIAKGHIARPWMGVSLMPLNPRSARQLGLAVDKGLIVGNVYRGSGAAQAGLRASVVQDTAWGNTVLQQLGDVILTVNGQTVASTDDLQTALKDKRPGQTVEVEILRQNRRINLTLTLSELPQEYR
ncbi:MAG: trypsin-like peptidase domain-containing protein [Acidobacteria bacterium]|nr:trypsin-like peptidase domain-containing protein [Acidobacteriota bacterium]